MRQTKIPKEEGKMKKKATTNGRGRKNKQYLQNVRATLAVEYIQWK